MLRQLSPKMFALLTLSLILYVIVIDSIVAFPSYQPSKVSTSNQSCVSTAGQIVLTEERIKVSLSRIVVVLEMGGWSSEVKLRMQFKSLVLKIFIVWDSCQNFQNKFKLWRHLPEWISVVWDGCQKCQNEFKLWGRLPECISIGWDGCQICHFYHWDRCQNQIWQKLIGLPSILAKAIAPLQVVLKIYCLQIRFYTYFTLIDWSLRAWNP